MFKVGLSEKVFPVVKIATVVEALADEGISATDALPGTGVSAADLESASVRISIEQILHSYRNALALSRDPHCGYHTGLRFHVSTFGMYGFAILSSADFRQTMRFAVKYLQLTAPEIEISFKEERRLGIWTIKPVSYAQVDAALYKFIVELAAGCFVSIHRDVMGPAFRPIELHFAIAPPADARNAKEVFRCQTLYQQPENRVVFDAKWLEGKPRLGNAVTFAQALRLCDRMLEELRLRTGESGKVRKIVLAGMGKPVTFEAVARRLDTSTRTLRRRLRQEGTSFRRLIDELRSQMAVKHVRETDLTIEEIAFVMGFSDAAAFRRTFRRWTKRAPNEFRRRAVDF
jgi:AraC-like DNA-binding protein